MPELDFNQFMLLVGLPLLLFCTAIVDLTGRHFHDGSTKIIWAIVVLIVPYLGPILYFKVGTRQAGPTFPRVPRPRSHR